MFGCYLLVGGHWLVAGSSCLIVAWLMLLVVDCLSTVVSHC